MNLLTPEAKVEVLAPLAVRWRPEDGEPTDGTVAILAHPLDHQPERAYHRSDSGAAESGYGIDDDGHPTGQRWYELAESPEAPLTWADVVDEHYEGPIFVLRIPDIRQSAPSTTAADPWTG